MQLVVIRAFFLLALLVLILQVCWRLSPREIAEPRISFVGQSSEQKLSTGEMRPVKWLPSQTRSTAEIDFSDFEIQQMWISNHPGRAVIKGEPTKGYRFFARARIYGWEAIATAKFEAVDVNGNFIEKILIQREPGPTGGSEFYGVIKTPDRPFRVVLSGEGLDGRSYTRTYERLFKPTTHPQSPILIPPDVGGMERRQLEALAQKYLDKSEQEVRKNAAEIIVIPRVSVSNVMYAPYLSNAGRPLGVHITFDVEFSHDGYYNPELHVVPEYKKDDWRGRIEMKPLTGSIEPKPAESGSPQIQPHILAFGAGYLYRAGTTYHFTAEYIPDYVIQNEKKTKFCIWNQQYKHTPEFQAAWRAILASKAPTKYTLNIDNTNFYGVIEGLHPQRTLYESFVTEGALDCGEQPNRRF